MNSFTVVRIDNQGIVQAEAYDDIGLIHQLSDRAWGNGVGGLGCLIVPQQLNKEIFHKAFALLDGHAKTLLPKDQKTS